jgi:putative ABC transport system permease protein
MAWASLRRHPLRTVLAVLGVAVSAAMLLDMVMLASGMQASFRDLLGRQGFQLRLAPRGTMPFDTEARIAGATAVEAAVRTTPGVQAVAPLLGATLHLHRGEAAVAAFALGIRPAIQGDYEIARGSDVAGAGDIVANDLLLRRLGARVGDTVRLAAGYDPQLQTWTMERPVVVRGVARFFYLNARQEALALPLEALQSLGGASTADQVSLFMVRTDGRDAAVVRDAIERAVPSVSAISTAEAVASLEQRVSYFRQLALILGAVSLVVGFLLVTTLVTVSVQERIGELAVLRAIGVSRGSIAVQVLLEGLAIASLGVGLGLVLGLVTARYLNEILRTFPGLPAAMNFFVFSGARAWRSLGMLLATGAVAGLVPAWRAASLPIAVTLRREAVG